MALDRRIRRAFLRYKSDTKWMTVGGIRVPRIIIVEEWIYEVA